MQLSEFSQTGNLLTLVVRAPIDKRRFRAICRDMDQAVPALGTVRIVIVMRHYRPSTVPRIFWTTFGSCACMNTPSRRLPLFAIVRGRIPWWACSVCSAVSGWIFSVWINRMP
nr:hypothetical protein [Desulfosarcina cetonica]